MKYWVVTCPENKVQGGVWLKWYQENCVAVGWPPSRHKFQGDATKKGWVEARNHLKKMNPGDKVIPFLLDWRIGPIGKIIEVKVTDTDWSPTVPKGDYKRNREEAELGRRILLEWEINQMPVNGQIALIPEKHRRKHARVARSTIKEITKEDFDQYAEFLKNPNNWRTMDSGLTKIKTSPSKITSQRTLRDGFEEFLENINFLKKNL